MAVASIAVMLTAAAGWFYYPEDSFARGYTLDREVAEGVRLTVNGRPVTGIVQVSGVPTVRVSAHTTDAPFWQRNNVSLEHATLAFYGGPESNNSKDHGYQHLSKRIAGERIVEVYGDIPVRVDWRPQCVVLSTQFHSADHSGLPARMFAQFVVQIDYTRMTLGRPVVGFVTVRGNRSTIRRACEPLFGKPY